MQIIRTQAELDELANTYAEAMDDGVPGASLVVDVLEWLNNPNAGYPAPAGYAPGEEA